MERETEIEFERLLRTYANRLSADEVIRNMDSIKRQAREHATGRKLMLDEAERLNIEVPESEIQKAVARTAERFGGEAPLKAHLDSQGMTLQTLRDRLRDARKVEKLVERITSDIPDPTEAEALRYFHSHRGEFAESVCFDDVKAIAKLVIANERKNERLVAYIAELKGDP